MVEEAAHGMNMFSYLADPANWVGPAGIWNLLLQHLVYTAASVAIAAAIAIPLGIFIGHTGHGSFLVIGLSNAARAIPTLGLLVLVVLLLGTGVRTDHRRLGRARAAGHSDRHSGRD